MAQVNGLDYLGFDFLDIAKGAAGALSGTGSILSPKKDDKQADIKAALDRQRLEDAKAAAERSAAQTKTIALAAGGAIMAATVTFLVLRKK